MTDEPIEAPDETKLMFPSRGRELDVFFDDVPGLTRHDGGKFIGMMSRRAVGTLYDIAATSKATLAKRLGLDADGRAWIELPSPHLGVVSDDRTCYTGSSESRRTTVHAVPDRGHAPRCRVGLLPERSPGRGQAAPRLLRRQCRRVAEFVSVDPARRRVLQVTRRACVADC
jgi:hypothetical protein